MPTYPSPTHPLGPPSISGTEITVDVALQNPTRITRTLEDLTLRKFLVDKVFSNGGGVSGGAVLYDQLEANDLYLTRDVKPIEPGGEYPILDGERRAPKIAPVEKYGGRISILDETRDRNETGLFARKVRQLGNTLVRKNNDLTMAVLDAAVVANSRTLEGNNWQTVKTAGSEAASAQKWPLADLALAQVQAEKDEMGVTLDLIILNPQEYAALVAIYGVGGLKEVLASIGFSYFVSNRQTAGKAKVVASGQVGEYRVEQPIQTVNYRDEDHDRTWVKSSVKPVQFVDNPFGIVELTKLAG